MTEIAFTTRDSGGLCRAATLRSGHELHRHRSEPGAWRCERIGAGRPMSLLRLVRELARLPVVAAAYGTDGSDPFAEQRVLDDLRARHGLRFLWTFCVHGDGILVYDELDEPQSGRYRFALEGGCHIPADHAGTDPLVRAWFGLGPSPTDLRRAYEAAACAVHALNTGLGARSEDRDAPRKTLVPRLPWRVLATEDQIYINDAYDREIMSLRTPTCRLLKPVSPEAARAADMLIRSVNALPALGDPIDE